MFYWIPIESTPTTLFSFFRRIELSALVPVLSYCNAQLLQCCRTTTPIIPSQLSGWSGMMTTSVDPRLKNSVPLYLSEYRLHQNDCTSCTSYSICPVTGPCCTLAQLVYLLAHFVTVWG